MKYYFIIFVLFFQIGVQAASLKVKVIEKGTRVPLKEISVYLLPDKIKLETNSQGFAESSEIKTSLSQVVISVAGYLRYDKEIQLDNLQELTVYLEKESYAGFETVITDAKTKRDQSQKTLSRKEFLEMPGANGDPLKAVQNLPGINRAQGFSSAVVVQGSAPKDTAYDFEGHNIPIVFHFGGLSSVVMPEALEQVDYLSAGYQSDYSRALGGIISLKSRKPEVKERDAKGLFYIDNLSTGGLFETKIDEKSSLLVSGRYSYIGFFLKNALKGNDMLDLTVAPEFQDITAIYNREISESENLKVSLLSSRDRLAFVFAEPLRGDPSIRGDFSNTIQFYRIIPAWTKKVDVDTTYRLSLGVGQDEIGVEIGDQFFKLKSQVLTARGEFEKKMFSDKWLMQLGLDNQYSNTQVDLKLPINRSEGGISNPISTGEKRQARIQSKTNNIGLYFRNDVALTEQFSLMPGVRYDRFGRTKETFLLPRLAAKYKYDESLLFKAGSGLYVQPPEPQEASEDYGNPDVKSPQAIHLTLGFEKDNRLGSKEGHIFSMSVFDRWYNKLVVQSSAQTTRNGTSVYELYNNDGRGRSYGIEAQWKFNQTDYNGFISYTWSKSTRWSRLQPEYNFEYDQTHNFNIVVAKPFAHEWKVSSRFRYVTGNPMTPVVGSTYDADNEVYFPKRGALYSQRLKDFYQLDVRVDKKVIFDRAIWTFYLDVQNILNTKNPESIQYSYDYAQKEQISGLPILPAVGIKGEF
jgi:outer membrane receptor protein involved in Fe transport